MDGWTTEYTKTNEDTHTRLVVVQKGAGWFWAVEDMEVDWCNLSGVHFNTPEEAARECEEFYLTEWLPFFQATGVREGPM